MITSVSAGMHRTTIGDVIVAVMDAAMTTVKDEAIAAEIAGHVLVNILDKFSPRATQEIVSALGDNELD